MSFTHLTKRSIGGGLMIAAIAVPATAQARFDQNPVYLPRAAAVCVAASPRRHVRVAGELQPVRDPGGAVGSRPRLGSRRAGHCSVTA